MKKISTYIFIHDQQILLDCELSGKFKTLPDVKYVFLGLLPVDKIERRKDVVIARNLQYNIEHLPKFCSFTGWYVLWKNNLIQSEYVHLFEYDITVSDNFNEVTIALMNEKYDFIGYVPLPISFGLMTPIQYLSNLLPAIEKHHNVCIRGKLYEAKSKNKDVMWSSTSNGTFSLQLFNKYMPWFEQLMDALKESPMSGHAHERSLTFFHLINKSKMILIDKLLVHKMLNSHKT